jgi:hypothetical protein
MRSGTGLYIKGMPQEFPLRASLIRTRGMYSCINWRARTHTHTHTHTASAEGKSCRISTPHISPSWVADLPDSNSAQQSFLPHCFLSLRELWNSLTTRIRLNVYETRNSSVMIRNKLENFFFGYLFRCMKKGGGLRFLYRASGMLTLVVCWLARWACYSFQVGSGGD